MAVGIEKLRKRALRHPDTSESIACAGTALEKRTVTAKKKAFLFLGRADLMLKLGPSLGEATALARRHAGCCKVGAHGWVTVQLDGGLPLDVVERWIDESYELALGAKKPVKKAAKKASKKASAKKKYTRRV